VKARGSQRKPEYTLLQKVSHWTDEDVAREKKVTELGHDFIPTITLDTNFSEIFMHCDFQTLETKHNSLTTSENQFALETWKKTVDVQQHFNDLEMRLRNYAITIVGAMVAAVGFTYQAKLTTSIFGLTFPTGALLIVAASLAWGAFYFMDRFGYHVLLKGAVAHAGKIEGEYSGRIPGIGLGMTVSDASKNVSFFGIKTDSNTRINIFYSVGALMLFVLLIAFLFADVKTTETPAQNKNDAQVQTQNEAKNK